MPSVGPRFPEDREVLHLRQVYVAMLTQKVEVLLNMSAGSRLALRLAPPPAQMRQPHWRRRGGRAARAMPCPPKEYVVEVPSLLLTTDLVKLPMSHR